MAKAIDAMEFPAKKNKIKTSTGEKIFTVFNYAFFTLLCLLMLYPFWHVLMQSLSSMEEALKGGVFLYPKGFNLDTYVSVFKNPQIYSGFGTTIFATVVGSVLGTLVTAMTAYPLSKTRLRGGKIIMVLVLFTMIQRRHDPQLFADPEFGSVRQPLGFGFAHAGQRLQLYHHEKLLPLHS